MTNKQQVAYNRKLNRLIDKAIQEFNTYENAAQLRENGLNLTGYHALAYALNRLDNANSCRIALPMVYNWFYARGFRPAGHDGGWIID
jgi:hypothetical protein